MAGDSFARWYRLIVETADEGVWLLDAEGTTLFVNPKVTEILGYTSEELLGRPAQEFVPEETLPQVEEALGARRAGERAPRSYSVRLRRRDGAPLDVLVHANAILDDGVYVGTLAMLTDITDRRRVERELQASERRFRTLAENAVDIVYRYRLEPDPGWDYLSPAVEAVTGFTPAEHYADPELAYRQMHPDDLARVHARDPGALPTEPETYRFFHRDGRTIWIERRNWIVRDDDGRPVAIEGIGRDVTDRVNAEEELRQTEQRFRAVFDNSRAAMLIVDDGRRFVEVNEAACELMGRPRDELLGLTIDEVSANPERAEPGWRSFIATGGREGTYHVLRPDGTIRVVEFTATANIQPGRHLSVLYDVTQRRQLEEELRQSHKMEAIGQLAGGVAHDFNNQLGAIRLTAELALNRLADVERLRAELERIVEITHSGSVLTRQLLSFSRKQLLAPRTVDLNDAVRGAEELLGRLIGEHIRLEADLHSEPLLVRADPAQLEQVLVNLSVNARDAMPGGGRLVLATRVVEDQAAIVVSDTGEGIEPGLIDRIFDPFFTTKPTGEGTGLGLAIVYAVANQAGGSVRVESELGRGTTFTMVLPIDREPLAEPAGRPATVQYGDEKILLVEDEPDVRDVVEAMLAECGYAVTSVDGPEAALAHAKAHIDPIELLLTDVLMPGMNGAELAAHLQELHPETRVLFMSGYAADAFGDPESDGVFLEKPFGAVELTAAIRRALASS